jgi:UDP-GlcNAc:undecaprenyl-phosphate GlcNAc-1-phosphate transferase
VINLPIIYLTALLAALIISAVLTAVVKKLAIKTGFVAHPQQDRFHKGIIPLGGGIAIFATMALFCIAAIVCVKLYPSWTSGETGFYIQDFAGKIQELIIVVICSAVLFGLGLWDDIKNLGPRTKLIVQFAAAFVAAYFADIRVELFIESRIITSIMSAFWIVLIINVFNFLDNMDGASAGIALIVSIILFFTAALSGQIFVAGFALIFAGTLAGFLVFNFFPASIFMGDAGSLVVGFFIALITLRTTYYQSTTNGKWYVVLMPLVIMALPLYDFISVTVLRISQGKSPFVGDTQHFSHRLKKRGLTEVQTVLTLYLATLATGLGAIILKIVNSTYGLLVFVQTVLVLAIIAILESTGKNDLPKQQ